MEVYRVPRINADVAGFMIASPMHVYWLWFKEMENEQDLLAREVVGAQLSA